VLVNLAHSPSKQRFTAAHELGHHLRDHELVLDRDTEWLARAEMPSTDRERLAEAFAAWFLMPKTLIETTLAKLGLQTETIDDDGVYALSLELGTSYAATVRHLADMRLLPAKRREQLLAVAPQAIKSRLGGTDVARDAWKNVHRVDISRSQEQIAVLQGDAIVVEAPEVPSSGYLWHVISSVNGLALIRDEYRAPKSLEIGGRGWHRFLFRVETPGRWELVLEMRRPWQRGEPAEVAHVAVSVQPQPAAGIVQPLLLVA
jgi:Zn-dependent peptidase ImmA (M78 family)